LLHAALRSERHGVNILVHAPSAVGKTELVRSVAHQAEVLFYEIAGDDHEGSTLSAIERLRCLKRCQRLFGSTAHALLLDDADDLFPVTGGAFGDTGGTSLKWLHDLVERNARPVFWIMRDASRLPRSVLDRFAFVAHLPDAADVHGLVRDDCFRLGLEGTDSSMWRGASPGNALRTVRTLELLEPLLQHRMHPLRGWVPQARERIAPDLERSDEEVWAEIHAITPAQAPERSSCLAAAGLAQMLDGLRAAASPMGEGCGDTASARA
jgi:hypothetical protein